MGLRPEIGGGEGLSLVGTKLLGGLEIMTQLHLTTFPPAGDLGQAPTALDQPEVWLLGPGARL